MDIDKKQILDSFIRIVDHISDKEYQKRVWIRGDGPQCDDFVETVCFFFPEAEGILENYKQFGITSSQYRILVKFHGLFRTFSDENDWPEKFIDTPEWEKITEMAKEVLKAFNYQKSSK